MTISFTSVVIHSRRRLRLVFSESLAAGAFTTLTYYTVTCLDAGGVDPGVVAAFVVSGSPVVVEISLNADLVDGSGYTVGAVGVPASGGSSTPAGSELPFRLGGTQARPVAATPEDDPLASLFGADLVWNGSDLVEDASGDLAAISGRENAKQAVKRRLMSDGLTWNPAYGGKPRGYVDGPSTLAGELRGKFAAQAVADDRVSKATATVLAEDETQPEVTNIETTIVLIDGTQTAVQTGVQTQ